MFSLEEDLLPFYGSGYFLLGIKIAIDPNTLSPKVLWHSAIRYTGTKNVYKSRFVRSLYDYREVGIIDF